MAGILDEFLLIFKPQVQGSGFQKLNNHLKRTTDNLFSMKNLFRTFVGYDIYSGIKQFTTSMVDATREMGAMRSRFFAITGDEAKANKQLQWAFDLATRTAMPMKEVADSYSIFYAATQKSFGDSGAQQVFQDWTEVSRVLHMSTYQFERVTYALREMASKGAIYSQDLRMQIGTHVPNAMGLAEKAVNELGVTGSDWFEDFRKKAKGNQKLINQFIVLFSKYAKEMYASPEALAKAMKQPDAQIARLINQWDKLRYAIADSGFSDDLMQFLFHVNNLLDKILGHSKEMYGILKAIGGILATLFFMKGFQAAGKGLSWLFGTRAVRTGVSTFAFLKKQYGLWKAMAIFLRQTALVVLSRILGTSLTKLSLIPIVKALMGGLLKRGIISLIPGIGQIVFTVWLIVDVCKLLWRILSAFFPNTMRWIALLGSEILDVIIHPIVSLTEFFKKYHLFGFGKDNYTAPKIIPEGDAFKQTYSNMMPLSNYGIGGTPNTYNFSPTITSNTTINGSNLSTEDLEKAINNANNTNRAAWDKMQKDSIARSKY